MTIPAATRVQSVPDPDQSPQSFETTAVITARVEWNAVPAQTGETIVIAPGLTELYVAGTGNSIQQGDAILIVGRERMQDVNSDRWDVRWIDAVEPDTARNVTRLTWTNGLGNPWSPPTGQGIHVYVFRQRATLFGSSAADSKLLQGIKNYDPSSELNADGDWTNKSIDTATLRIDLDAPYPKIVRHGWVALAGGSGGTPPTGDVELYRITGVTQSAVVLYAMSGKVTRLTLDSPKNLDPTIFGLRTTFALAQSDELKRTKRPLLYPLYGSVFSLGKHEPRLQPGRMIAVSGKLQRVAIPPDVTGISFSDGSTPRPDDTYAMVAPPEVQISASEWQPLAPGDLDPGLTPSGTWRWSVADDDVELTITAPAGSLLLQAALSDDDVVSECVTLVDGDDAVQIGIDSTQLTLTTSLVNCYDRTTVTVNANVAPATHGETVGEIGGSGDAAQASQRFALKQAPLTYVSSSSDPSGAASTLQARVDDVLWSERSTLYGQRPEGPRLRAAPGRQRADDGRVRRRRRRRTPADGAEQPALRLPKGPRRGGQPAHRPAQHAAVAAARREVGDQPDAGQRRPGRRDAGARAQQRAAAHPDARSRRLGAGLRRLRACLRRHRQGERDVDQRRPRSRHLRHRRRQRRRRDPERQRDATEPDRGTARATATRCCRSPCRATARRPSPSPRTSRSTPAYDAKKVRAAVKAALVAAFAFDVRDFGEPVTIDEVYATMQGVAGVIAADIQQLYRIDTGPISPQPQPRLIAALPAVQSDGSVNPAELLTLDSGPLRSLGVMS